jgi:hypothetical protein
MNDEDESYALRLLEPMCWLKRKVKVNATAAGAGILGFAPQPYRIRPISCTVSTGDAAICSSIRTPHDAPYRRVVLASCFGFHRGE